MVIDFIAAQHRLGLNARPLNDAERRQARRAGFKLGRLQRLSKTLLTQEFGETFLSKPYAPLIQQRLSFRLQQDAPTVD